MASPTAGLLSSLSVLELLFKYILKNMLMLSNQQGELGSLPGIFMGFR
jgi:hypothetical protein